MLILSLLFIIFLGPEFGGGGGHIYKNIRNQKVTKKGSEPYRVYSNVVTLETKFSHWLQIQNFYFDTGTATRDSHIFSQISKLLDGRQLC